MTVCQNYIKNLSYEQQFIHRQYNEKWRFTDSNLLIKRMQCVQVLSFCNYPVSSDFQNYDVPISTCKFSSKSKDILAVANENGVVCIQSIKNSKDYKYVQSHTNTVYDIAWMPENSKFVTVSGDNSAKLWDCAESNVNLISVFRGHKRSVRCVTFKPENTAVFATGSRDGSLMIWDARAKKKCAKFSHHLPDQIIPYGAGSSQCGAKLNSKKSSSSSELLNSKSVTGLLFQNDNNLISCGSLDNVIRVWDMRKTYSRSASNIIAKHQLCSPYSGFSYLCMNALGTKLYANCMDSYIYCFNISAYDSEPVAAFYGHENGSFYVKSSLSLDGKYLLSGSSDESAYIWNTKFAEFSEEAVKPVVSLSSHLAEVTCVEMSPDNMFIVTCSDDGTFRMWNTLGKIEDNEKKVDIAACYESENTTYVKTIWRNKRKYDKLIDCQITPVKDDDLAPHTKICRFYNANLSLACLCQNSNSSKKGNKRLSEAPLIDLNPSKKKFVFASQERTPPRQGKTINFLPRQLTCNLKPTNPNPTLFKSSSKRKLEDSPSFIEESNKTKKVNYSKTLIQSNSCTEKELKVKNQRIPPETVLKEKQIKSDDSTCQNVTLISSPTSNLPNYVEDGTSPYIHRCRKTVQKENDWLTKLQETHKTLKTPQEKRVNLPCLKNGQEPKKKIKLGEQTLHKYFKVSSKPTEKNFTLPEMHKKTILIK